MQGKMHWNEKPHITVYEDSNAVHICRMAPGETDLMLEWLDGKGDGTYFLEWRGMYAGEDWQRQEVCGCEAHLGGLAPWRDYEIRVVRTNGEASGTRLFRTAPVPGTVINYLHPKDTRYAFSGRALCSPNLIRLPSGKLLASMDVYEGRGPQNLSLLFRSDDRGAVWHYVCDLFPLFWGKMFFHDNRLYMIGCSTEFGDVIIGASDDEGETWTAPTHLFIGSCTVGSGWQQSPMPVVEHNGRLHVSMEYAGRTVDTGACVLSAPADADLLDPKSWSMTQPLQPDPAWLGTPGSRIECFIEGNLFVSPEGELRSMLRVDADGINILEGRSPVLRVNGQDPEAPLEFLCFVPMPAGFNNKFTMQFDPVSGYYIAIGNLPTDRKYVQQRNILALFCSRDAVKWTTVCRIIDGEHEPGSEVGFQYPSFVIDGNDILLQVRTAMNGARDFHDANYSTFHVIPRFRELLK